MQFNMTSFACCVTFSSVKCVGHSDHIWYKDSVCCKHISSAEGIIQSLGHQQNINTRVTRSNDRSSERAIILSNESNDQSSNE